MVRAAHQVILTQECFFSELFSVRGILSASQSLSLPKTILILPMQWMHQSSSKMSRMGLFKSF